MYGVILLVWIGGMVMRPIDATRLVKLALLERDKIPLTIVHRYSFGTESPNHHGQSMRGGIRKVLRLIEQAPTIDAVPVVRCKECKNRGLPACPMLHTEYYWDEDDGTDVYDTDNTHDDGFCDLGARMDGEA